MESAAKQRSMLKILLATCEQTLDALTAADNPVDEELLADLRRMIERTRAELTALSSPSSDGAS
jgi:hypothetical protein